MKKANTLMVIYMPTKNLPGQNKNKNAYTEIRRRLKIKE